MLCQHYMIVVELRRNGRAYGSYLYLGATCVNSA